VVRLVLIAALATACRVTDPFMCSTSADCRDGAMTGVCAASGYCSFPDPTCTSSGQRYDDSAGGGLGGMCAPTFEDPNDPDKDGIGIGDNCPNVANPDQHDEDQDGAGDACDPCPFSASAIDTDGDGLPDACDPYPMTPGDKLVLFEGFGAGVPKTWTTTNTWMTKTDSITSVNAATFTLPIPSTLSETVMLGVTLPTISGPTIVAIDDPSAPSDTAVECQMSSQLFVAQANQIKGSNTYDAMIDTPYIFALTRKSTAYACTVAQPIISANATLTAPTGSIQVRMPQQATIDWVLVVHSPVN
jgi:hypothetical protein